MMLRIFFLCTTITYTAQFLSNQAITCTFAPNEFAQQGLMPIAREIRTIIKTKLLGVQNYELRRSDNWYDRTLLDWRREIIEQADRLQAAASTYQTDARLTLQIPILKKKIELFGQAIDGLAQAVQQFYDDRRNIGILTDVCYVTLQIAEDLMLEFEHSANTIRAAYLPENVPATHESITQACSTLIGTKDTGWLVRLVDEQNTIPNRPALEREQMPEIFKPHPEIDRQFGDRFIGVNKAG